MQRKYLMLTLLSALIFGTAVAALSQVKAHGGTSDVYVYIEPHIYPGVTGGMIVDVMIDSPDTWDNAANGIVGWALSVRVDPTVLTVYANRKGQPQQPTADGSDPGGFLELYLVRHGYNTYDWLLGWTINYPTDFYNGEINATSGTMLDISEFIRGTLPGGVGAGGGPYTLCELIFIDADGDDTTSPSVIDLFGPPRPDEIPPITVNPQYMLADGTWHEVEFCTDGAYIAETPDKMYFDMPPTLGPPSNPGWSPPPIGSDWHELSPQLCNWWTLESHEDNAPGEPGVLDVSDQIDFIQVDGPEPGKVIWGHVDWINPQAEPGDGQADLIITVKPEIPEFPLGIEWIMTIALVIPVVYVWRRKRSK